MIAIFEIILLVPCFALLVADIHIGTPTGIVNSLLVLWVLLCLTAVPIYRRAKIDEYAVERRR